MYTFSPTLLQDFRLPPFYLYNSLLFPLLIAKATNRIKPITETEGHISGGIIESDAPSVRIIVVVPVSTPEKGFRAEIVVVTVSVITSGKSRETSRIVGGRIVIHGTGGGTITPSCCGSQRLGDIGAGTTAHILANAACIIDKLCPFGIAWQMPSCGTDALYSAWIIITAASNR